MLNLLLRRYKSTEFAQAVLDIILELKVSSWTSLGDLCAENIRVEKVAGSLTNAVFFVSYIGMPSAKTVLLRIYGPSSSELISRPRELHTLHVLSSIYRIGPRVYGTFENGRLEEFFESSALTASELRDPTLSAWIGARMAELHCVDIDAIEGDSGLSKQGCRGAWDIDAKKNFLAWLGPARKVLKLASVSAAFKRELAFDEFVEEWKRYMLWLEEWERQHGASKRVFSHNDAQYGNLLRRKEVKEGTPDHRQVSFNDCITISFALMQVYFAPFRLLWSILNMQDQIPLHSTLPTTFTNGPLTIMTRKRHTSLTHRFIQAKEIARTFIDRISSTLVFP